MMDKMMDMGKSGGKGMSKADMLGSYSKMMGAGMPKGMGKGMSMPRPPKPGPAMGGMRGPRPSGGHKGH